MARKETPKKTPKNLKRKKEDEPQQEEHHQSDESVAPSKKTRIDERNYQATIHILNLSETTTEQSLRDFFDDCGTIVHIFMFKRNPQGKQYPSHSAQIEFSSTDEAANARGKDQQSLDGRTLHVKEAHAPVPPEPTDQIRIAGFDKSTTESDIRAALSAHQSHILEVIVPVGEDGAGRGFAIIKLDGVESAQKIFTSYNTPINGIVPRIYYHLEKPKVKENKPRRDSREGGRGGASRERDGGRGDRGGRGGRGGDRGGRGGRGQF